MENEHDKNVDRINYIVAGHCSNLPQWNGKTSNALVPYEWAVGAQSDQNLQRFIERKRRGFGIANWCMELPENTEVQSLAER